MKLKIAKSNTWRNLLLQQMKHFILVVVELIADSKENGEKDKSTVSRFHLLVRIVTGQDIF